MLKSITKKEFVENLSAKESIFLGTAKRIIGKDNLYDTISHVLNTITETRTCTKKSDNHIVFSDNSHLYLNDKGSINKCYLYEYDECVVYIMEKTTPSEAYGELQVVMYYLIKK